MSSIITNFYGRNFGLLKLYINKSIKIIILMSVNLVTFTAVNLDKFVKVCSIQVTTYMCKSKTNKTETINETSCSHY